MRKARIAFFAALLGLVAVAPARSTPTAAPTLRFLDLTPAMARGTNFAPATTVYITFVAGSTKLSRVVRSSSGGGFVVGFGVVPRRDRCSGYVRLIAVESGGRRATYRLPPMACTTAATGKAPVDTPVDKSVDSATAKVSTGTGQSIVGASR